MIKHLTYLLILPLIFSCSAGKSTSQGEDRQSSSRESAQFQETFFQGQKHKAVGDIDKAYIAFREASILSPENDAAYYEMSRIDFAKNRLTDAFTYIDKAIALAPENFWYHRLRADFLLESNQFDQAEKELEWLIDRRPEHLDAYYDLATTFLYREDGDGAIRTYNLLQEQIGVDPELSFQKQRIQLLIGKPEDAVKTLDELIEVYPEPEFIAQKAQLLLDMGKTDAAQQTLEKLIKEDPNNGLAHLQLSRLYVLKGMDDKSWESLKTAFASSDVSIDEKVTILFKYYDIAGLDPNAKNKAEELLKLLDEAHPKSAKTHSIHGDFYMAERRYAEARDRFDMAVELDPSKQLIWIQLLELDAQVADWDALLKHSQEALELFPSQPTYYLMNGIGHLQKEDYQKGIQVLKAGKAYVIEDPALLAGFWSNLGDAYHAIGQYQKSDDAFESSLDAVPNDPFVMNNYSYYLATRGAKLARAAELSEGSNALMPGTASFQDTYGWVLFKQKKYEDAEEWIGRALKSTTPDAVLYEHYGDVLFHLGRTEEAAQYWKEALEIGGGSSVLPRKVKDNAYYEEELE